MNQIIQYNQPTKLTNLEKVKKHLRVIHTRDDDYIFSLIDVASITIEDIIDRDIFSKKIKFSSSKSNFYQLGKTDSKIESIESIKIFKNNAEVGEITVYTLDQNFLSFNTSTDFDYVEVVFNVLSTFPSIPVSFEQSALIIIGDFYNQRQDIVTGRTTTNIKAVERLLGPYINYILK